MADDDLECEYCGRNNFVSQRALTAHQARSNACFKKMRASFGSTTAFTTAPEFMACSAIYHPRDALQDLSGAPECARMSTKLTPNARKLYVVQGAAPP